MHPVGREGKRTSISAEMKKDYLPQHQDETGEAGLSQRVWHF